MTDGSVLCQEQISGTRNLGTRHWKRLVPDELGSYVNGSWFGMPDLPETYQPTDFVAAVLSDGRVFIAGGEYVGDLQAETNQCFALSSSGWTQLPSPPGWDHIGDAPSCVLTDGRVLVGNIGDNKDNKDNRTAIFNPANNTWSAGPPKLNDSSTEESWCLLPDGSIITANCAGHPGSQLFVPGPTPKWIDAGQIEPDIVDANALEIGPALTLPDGRAAFVGGNGANAIYTPGAFGTAGRWTPGPSFGKNGTKTVGAKDAPAVLLPNGRVFLTVTAFDPDQHDASNIYNDYGQGTYFFEWDVDAATLNYIEPSDGNDSMPPFQYRMLLLPSGEVLLTNTTALAWIYTPDGAPDESWRPVVHGYPTTAGAGTSVRISGTGFNGLSQGSAYGDENNCATNYPLVRLVRGAKVYYGRTSNFSTMGIHTGAAVVSTDALLPKITAGQYDLEVVVNGIASQPVQITLT